MASKPRTRTNSKTGSNQGDIDLDMGDTKGDTWVDAGVHATSGDASGGITAGPAGRADSSPSLESMFEQQEKARMTQRMMKLESDLAHYKGMADRQDSGTYTSGEEQKDEAKEFFRAMMRTQQAIADKLTSIHCMFFISYHAFFFLFNKCIYPFAVLITPFFF